ncbi:hypothetical protein MLD38_039804 [Melastoma candidum]|uniref:Uncharacterized protein n=1 Tax=Melastoma candidum TaxID=119954 RepID=A0ACB9L4V8_9MYRT|nr:hypothetical protein MLD38_039804 [Melastoma candidum]
MGNRCCRPESSSIVWAWESSDGSETEEEVRSTSSSSSRVASSPLGNSGQPRRVKVVMKRKELQQLLRKADEHGELTAQDVTEWLTGPGRRNHVDGQHPSWRPVLTSIPESN